MTHVCATIADSELASIIDFRKSTTIHQTSRLLREGQARLSRASSMPPDLVRSVIISTFVV